MSFKQVIIFSCILFAAYVEASLGFGKCPDLKTKQDFNAAKYVGLWYEYAKYPYIFEAGGKCITAKYEAEPNGRISVENRQYNKLLDVEQTIEGYAVSYAPGKLNVTFPNFPGSPSSGYWVLDTDYKNYAVVWSCTDLGLFKQDVAWFLTRDRFPKKEIIETAKKVLESQHLSTKKLEITDQSDC